APRRSSRRSSSRGRTGEREDRPAGARLAARGARLRGRARRLAVGLLAARGAVPAAAAVDDRDHALAQLPPALRRRLVHLQGGARRLRDRLGARDRGRAPVRALAAGRRRAHAVRGRGERRADHRVRADHERLVRRPQPALEVGDRRRPLLPARDGEHAAGAHLRQARGDRADALVRGQRARHLPPRAHPGGAAVRLHGPAGGDRRPDRELDLALRLPVRVGGDRRRERVRDRLLRGRLPGRAGRAPGRPVDTGVAIGQNRRAGRARTHTTRGGRMRRKFWVGLGAVAATVAAAASLGGSAGASTRLTNVTLQLKWVTQAQFAGYYAAAAQGYYKDAGLNVTIKVGGPNITPET